MHMRFLQRRVSAFSLCSWSWQARCKALAAQMQVLNAAEGPGRVWQSLIAARGYGTNTIFFGSKGMEATGVDLSPEAIAEAERRRDAAGAPASHAAA